MHLIQNRRWFLRFVALLISLAALLTLSGVARADGATLSQIQAAIQEKGLHWTPKDYGREFPLGLLLELDPELRAQVPRSPEPELAALPTQLDWRSKNGYNYVSPIKDQGNCGSCWAFASVAALESQYAIANGSPGSFLDLSEQILVSCESHSAGCDGGYAYWAAYFLETQGTWNEQCYPYTGADGNCNNACSDWRINGKAYKIANFYWVSQSVSALKQALQYGPVQTALYVYSDFRYYGRGVYEYSWGNYEGGHAVLLVGYVDTPGLYGGGYFIVKNSWSPYWGESGYFKIGYSQLSSPVQFGLESYRYVVTPDGPPPTATPTYTPTPTKTPIPSATPTNTPTPTDTPVPGDAYEPDNTYTEAKPIAAGEQQLHSIVPAEDRDWVTFTLSQAWAVVLETSGDPGGDTMLDLWLSSGTYVIGDDDSGEGNYSKIATTLSPGTYYLRIKSYEDSVTPPEAIASYTIAFRVGNQASIPLAEGWNLVSLPLVPLDTAIEAVLASISGTYAAVLSTDPITGEWLYYFPGVSYPQSTLGLLDERSGFWILMLSPATLTLSGSPPGTTQQTLRKGWNLIAYPSGQTRPVAQALTSISGHYRVVYGYDAQTNTWMRYAPGVPAWANTLPQLEGGHAYLIDADGDCTLTIEG